MRASRVAFVTGLAPTWALVAVSAGLVATATNATAGSRNKKPTAYTVEGASVTLGERDISRRDAESKSVAFGPKPGQMLHMDTAAWVFDDVQFTLTVVTLPVAFRSTPADRLLQGVKKGLLEPAGQGAVLDQEDKKPVALPGGVGECMALNIRTGSRRVRARVAVHEGRIYQLTAVGSKSDVEASEVSAALDSFSISAPTGP